MNLSKWKFFDIDGAVHVSFDGNKTLCDIDVRGLTSKHNTLITCKECDDIVKEKLTALANMIATF